MRLRGALEHISQNLHRELLFPFSDRVDCSQKQLITTLLERKRKINECYYRAKMHVNPIETHKPGHANL